VSNVVNAALGKNAKFPTYKAFAGGQNWFPKNWWNNHVVPWAGMTYPILPWPNPKQAAMPTPTTPTAAAPPTETTPTETGPTGDEPSGNTNYSNPFTNSFTDPSDETPTSDVDTNDQSAV
jgi:hypothetical protein